MTINEHAMKWWKDVADQARFKFAVVDQLHPRDPVVLITSEAGLPVIFPVIHAWNAYSQMYRPTKGDLAELRLQGYTYDTALPQGWLDSQANYDHARIHHVWLYDGKARMCGRPFYLLGSEEPEPVKQNCTV